MTFSDIRFIDQQHRRVKDGRGLMVSFRRLSDEFTGMDATTPGAPAVAAAFDGPRPAGSDGAHATFHLDHARTYRVEMTLSPEADWSGATFPNLKVRVTVDDGIARVVQLYDLQTDETGAVRDRIRTKGPFRIYGDADDGNARSTGVRQTFKGRLLAVVRAELVVIDANGAEVSTGMYTEQTVARASGAGPVDDDEGTRMRTVSVRLFTFTTAALGAGRIARLERLCNELYMQCALSLSLQEIHVGAPGINVFEVIGQLPSGISATLAVSGTITPSAGPSTPFSLPLISLPAGADNLQIATELTTKLVAAGFAAERATLKSGRLVLLPAARSITATCSIVAFNAGGPIQLAGGRVVVHVPEEPQHLSFTDGFDLLPHSILALNFGLDRTKPTKSGRGANFDVFVLPAQSSSRGLIYTRSRPPVLALTWPKDVLETAAPDLAANTAAVPVNRLGLDAPSDANDDGRILAHEIAHALANHHDKLHEAEMGLHPGVTLALQHWVLTQTGIDSAEQRKRFLHPFHVRVRGQAAATGLLT